MSEVKLLLQKIPKAPAARIKLLTEFLTAWGVHLKPKKFTPAIAAAKKRVGTIPKCLPDFYESGLFDWFQKIAKKRPEWYLNLRWLSLEDLSVDEQFKLLPIVWDRHAEVTGVARQHLKLSDPPVTIWRDANRMPKRIETNVKLSEFLLREGVVNILRTQPARAFHEEDGAYKPDHPSRLRLREKLKPISIDPNRQGTELYFEGPGIVARERCPPVGKNIDIEIAATSKAVLDSYLDKTKPAAKTPAPSAAKTMFWDASPTKAALKKANGGFPSDKFKSKSATISANIFEAPSGYSIVDWAISIQFGEVNIDGQKFNCGINADKIRYDIKNWRQLDGSVFAGDRKLSQPQVHFYSGAWDSVERYEFRIKHQKGKKFQVDVRFELAGIFPNYTSIICSCDAVADFTGIYLNYDNFTTRKLTPKRRDDLLAELFDEKAFQIKHEKGRTDLLPKTR